MQQAADEARSKNLKIGFVPTMGFLHEGHLSLIRLARKKSDRVVVSIFVNPTQFGPGEDFETYPRNFERDAELVRQEGTDIIFNPSAKNIYTENFQTVVNLDRLPNHLCGLSRPVHFQGVATIVSKLFNIVKPHVAVFGEKDYQQLAVIRQMVVDLNFDIEIVGGPIVRESDGLAMSSRNTYLSSQQRQTALCLHQALLTTVQAVAEGQTDVEALKRQARTLIESHPETRIDYISICDPKTLEDLSVVNKYALLALAVYVGKTRLIDNIQLKNKS